MPHWIEKGLYVRGMSLAHLEWVKSELAKEAFVIFELNGIASCEDFVREIKVRLPLDPPIVRGVWEAIRDSLSSALIARKDTKFAILWLNADKMMQQDGDNFATAVLVLSEAASDLERENGSVLRIFLSDDGSYFESHDLSHLGAQRVDPNST